MNSLSIQPSPIHGLGVFSERAFKPGEMVIDWKPCVREVTASQLKEFPKVMKQFVHFRGNKSVILQSPGRYLNHSCNPNTKVIDGSDRAVRNIQKGDEITTNYFLLDIPFLRMACCCGSDNCRRIIERKQE